MHVPTSTGAPRTAQGLTDTGENRLPPAAAVTVAIAVYATLPSSLLLTNRLVVPIVEGLLLAALIVTNPSRMTRQTRFSRQLSIALAVVMIATNLTSLGMLISQISEAEGSQLLVAAMQTWLTGVIGFALLFWELDRGGPVARRNENREELPAADFRFSQDENHDAVVEVRASSSRTADWRPLFVDYTYLSLTNSSAFSPTDTMPLSSRAKILMGIQATSALLISLVLVAFAVGSLGS